MATKLKNMESSSVDMELTTACVFAPLIPESATERPISVPRKPRETDTPGMASARCVLESSP